MKNVREKLIEEFMNEYEFGLTKWMSGKVADFIIARDKKIVAPLVKHKKLWCGSWQEYTASQAIDQTLTNAGVDV